MALSLRAFISRTALNGRWARLKWTLIGNQIQHGMLGLFFIFILFGQNILLLVLLVTGHLDW